MENPKSGKRKWRLLEGDDPDQETLAAKIHFLEERLNDKKEMLLEKDLILEEVTALSDKLRKQAQDGRADTLDLAQKVNLLRSRIQVKQFATKFCNLHKFSFIIIHLCFVKLVLDGHTANDGFVFGVLYVSSISYPMPGRLPPLTTASTKSINTT